jgi:hypothetical protein
MGPGVRGFTWAARWVPPIACAVALGALAGCSGSHGAAEAGTTVSTTAPSPTTPTTAAATSSSQASVSGSTTVPADGAPATTIDPAIAHPVSGIEFRSPSGNIHCEIDNGPPYPDHQAFCFSGSPAQSATLSDAGTYTTCTGTTCLANPAVDEVELPYGQSVHLGPFLCTSSTGGMTCTANGKGFEISSSGIAPAS